MAHGVEGDSEPAAEEQDEVHRQLVPEVEAWMKELVLVWYKFLGIPILQRIIKYIEIREIDKLGSGSGIKARIQIRSVRDPDPG